MGDRRVSHTTLTGIGLSSDLDALVPFWHSSLLDAQTDAERYALPVVSAPKNARQALKIDMVSAYALSRRLRVSTIGELFALLDKKVGHALLCGEEGWFVRRASLLISCLSRTLVLARPSLHWYSDDRLTDGGIIQKSWACVTEA